jgi:hypothetical protein
LHQGFIGRGVSLVSLDGDLPEGAVVAVPLIRLDGHTRQLRLIVHVLHTGLGLVAHVDHV